MSCSFFCIVSSLVLIVPAFMTARQGNETVRSPHYSNMDTYDRIRPAGLEKAAVAAVSARFLPIGTAAFALAI